MTYLPSESPNRPFLGDEEDVRIMRQRDLSAVPPIDEVERDRGVTIEHVELGGVRSLRISPARARVRGAILSVHGGGLVSGSRTTGLDWNSRMAGHLGVTVFVPEYRLVPEHPYPGPLDDVHAAWSELVDSWPGTGTGSSIALVGGSSGGGLAAGLVIRLLTRGGRLPDAMLLFQPQLDDRNSSPSSYDYLNAPFWDRSSNALSWSWYLKGSNGPPAEAAPSRATDFAGWPRSFVEIAQCDLFRDEGQEFASRLSQSGVPVEVHVWPGAFHGFDSATSTALARRALSARLGFLDGVFDESQATSFDDTATTNHPPLDGRPQLD
ncbi:alpha/beta hydrolase fold domain-containing protein [Microbacterium sp. ISL-59]|uniref:alpha/beta hydrolase fold domain-containing protein n=1 Tax=Microbacterium sp. ISL-59 TaxID=2819159 RepID=UPI001BEBCA69|nr:alpha/beta hydrolase fold domain-containing protein [Microbacterium sp. ISL-59]MBT2496730.1 alpha/beta hydrolase fold domain-containing protein [Microbacterium sp. ISL-59]